MRKGYVILREKVKGELRLCRDRDIRLKVELLLLGEKLGSVSEACSRRGFGRGFYYKWMKRLMRGKYRLSALSERSRKPKTRHPKQISRAIEARILRLRSRGYGAPSIRALLARREGIVVSQSTISQVLRLRRRPVKGRKVVRLKAHNKRYEIAEPGRIQLDVKYVPEVIGGLRAYNYVAVDECTRLRFMYTYYDLRPASTVDFLEKLKIFMPFIIHTIQTDNGFEFTNRLIPTHADIEHPMDRWCRENGVKHRCIPPGEKELNGKVERSHRIDEDFFYWRADYSSLDRFNLSLREWLYEYNHERLHGGLGYKTPIEKLLELYDQNRKSKIPNLNLLKDLPIRLQAYKLHYSRKLAA